jgi:uncharacterized protein YbjT (DUF2867 family)
MERPGHNHKEPAMTFAIAGVSGHTGRVAAETLLEAGEKVRVIVRDASKGEPWKARWGTAVEVALADLGDADALARALAGTEGAYLLIPPSMTEPRFAAYQQRIGEAIVEAVRRSQVPRVVLLSSVGAQQPEGTGPIKALGVVERALARLPGTVTVSVRAAYFMENLGYSLGMLAQGVLPSFLPIDAPFEMIATHDIGKAVADTLRQRPTRSSVIELAADRRYSMNDAAALLSRLTGHPVQARKFPIDALVPTLTGMGFTRDLAELYREMNEAFASGHVAFEGGHVPVRGTTPLEVVLRPLVPAATGAGQEVHPA